MDPALERDFERPVRWHAREAIPIFILTILISAVILALVNLRVRGDLLTVSGLVIQEAVMLVLVLAWVRGVSHSDPADLAFTGSTATNVGRGFGVGAVALVGAQVILQIEEAIRRALSSGAALQQPRQVQLAHEPSTTVAVVMGLGVLVLAPLAEEAFFRGFLYRGLRRSYGVLPSVMFSGVLFGAVHALGATSTADLTLFFEVVVPPLIFVGVVFAAAVEWTGSIVPTIVAHMLFNLLGFVQFMRHPLS